MSSELERRLEGLLAAAPEPAAGAGEKALARALSALRPVPPGRRGVRTAVLVFATAVVLLAIAAGSLAAAGTLHVSFSAKQAKPQRLEAPRALTLPPGAAGVAAVVDGRLSVVIKKGGFRLQGLPVTSAALSPHARYIAAGIGPSLVALRPDGSQAWSHPVGGHVVAIAWAPDGFRISYVVRSGRRLALHVIYGNGIHDSTIDRSVRAVQPSWRADSLAFAYVGAGGKAIVYDLEHESRRVVARSMVIAPVTQLAFSPTGAQLGLAGARGFAVEDRLGRVFTKRTQVAGIGWFGDEPGVVTSGSHAILRLDPQSNAIAPKRLPGRAIAFESDRSGSLVALQRRDAVEIVANTGTRPEPVLRAPGQAAVRDLQLR